MSTFCSANQGAEETVCLGKLFHFLLFRYGLVFPLETWSKSIKASALSQEERKRPFLSDFIWRAKLTKCTLSRGREGLGTGVV